jgi:hypothetical protein
MLVDENQQFMLLGGQHKTTPAETKKNKAPTFDVLGRFLAPRQSPLGPDMAGCHGV